MTEDSGGEIVVEWTRDALIVGNFSLHYYGMLIALGVLLGVLLAVKREKRLGLPKDTTIDLSLVCVPCALVGRKGDVRAVWIG